MARLSELTTTVDVHDNRWDGNYQYMTSITRCVGGTVMLEEETSRPRLSGIDEKQLWKPRDDRSVESALRAF